MAEGDLDGERRDVGVSQVAGAGPGVDAQRRELADPLGHADRIESHATIRAPAWPNASATALPICPARPTPVTSATLPLKSNAGAVMPHLSAASTISAPGAPAWL